MNKAHQEELSTLRALVLDLEADLTSCTETLERQKMFHEREAAMNSQKILELHDLLKQKDGEIHVSYTSRIKIKPMKAAVMSSSESG